MARSQCTKGRQRATVSGASSSSWRGKSLMGIAVEVMSKPDPPAVVKTGIVPSAHSGWPVTGTTHRPGESLASHPLVNSAQSHPDTDHRFPSLPEARGQESRSDDHQCHTNGSQYRDDAF